MIERGRKALLVVLRTALHDRRRRQLRRHEGLVHSVTRQRIDQTGGVADEKRATTSSRGARPAHRQAMASDVLERRRVHAVLPGEPVEMPTQARALRHPPADPEVRVVALREHPAVSAGHDPELHPGSALVRARGRGCSSGTFPSSATPRTIPSPRPAAFATTPFAPSAPTTKDASTVASPTRARTRSPSTSRPIDCDAVAEVGAGRDRALREVLIEKAALGHVDERLARLPIQPPPVSDPHDHAVDDVLDDRAHVARHVLERSAGQASAAGLVAREAGLVGEENPCARARLPAAEVLPVPVVRALMASPSRRFRGMSYDDGPVCAGHPHWHGACSPTRRSHSSNVASKRCECDEPADDDLPLPHPATSRAPPSGQPGSGLPAA